MADTKISALPASTTPLAGTEVLPIVQSGVTKQVSVANLTAGRAISASKVGVGTSTFDATYQPILQVESSAADGTGGLLIGSYLPTLTLYDYSGGAGASQIQQDGTDFLVKNGGATRFKISSTSDATLSSGNLIFSTSGKGIQGTTTNDNANAGVVGQYIESVVSTAGNCAASSAYFDVTSITLTAGDWDVSGILIYNQNGATWTRAYLAISPNAGDTGVGTTQGSNLVLGIWASSSTTPSYVPFTIPTYRVSVASTTTYYLKGNAFYSAGTPKYDGARISARRVR